MYKVEYEHYSKKQIYYTENHYGGCIDREEDEGYVTKIKKFNSLKLAKQFAKNKEDSKIYKLEARKIKDWYEIG